jgi:hypothetical protein
LSHRIITKNKFAFTVTYWNGKNIQILQKWRFRLLINFAIDPTVLILCRIVMCQGCLLFCCLR